MNKTLYIILAAIGILGLFLSLWQFVVSFVFMEFGRVLFYFILAALCIELSVYSVIKIVKKL